MDVLGFPSNRWLPLVCSNRHSTNHQLPPLSSLPKPNSSQISSITTRANILLSSTAKSKPLDQTLKLFRLLPGRDTVTWNTVVTACLRHGSFNTALLLFLDMLISGSQSPDLITIRSVLKACVELNALQLSLQMHAYIVKFQGLLSSTEFTILSTCLLNLYSKFELIGVAHEVFDKIPHKDVVAYTSMLSCYIEAGEHAEALRIFEEMVESDRIVLNEHVFSCALHACAGVSCLFGGRQIHAHVMKSMMSSDVFVGTSLIDMYVKCDQMECARNTFFEISEPNVVSWNALMAGNLDGEEILQLFLQMRLLGVSPDHVTFASVLRACKDILGISSVMQIHGLVVKTMGVGLDVYVGGALFEVYVDLGCFCKAQRIFDEIKEKDDVVFNLAIQGYVRNGHKAEAMDLSRKALEVEKELNELTVTSLLMEVGGLDHVKQFHALVIKFGNCDYGGSSSISGSLVRTYSEYHCLDDAIRLFERIHFPDLVLWTSLISGCSRIGKGQEALNQYVKMVSGGSVEPPNHYTFSSLLSSCAHLIAVEEGKQIHAQIVKANSNIKDDLFVSSGLLYMYAKCGYITEASLLFRNMPERDLASWNSMITVLSQHGFAEKAIETFQALLEQGDMEPNHITYVGVLSACSHCGMVEKGYQYFRSINEPTIDHYACLIDLVGRAGRLKEARDLVEEMPFEANELIWSSLLAASSIHGNIELGEYSAKHLLELNRSDPGTYVSLSNIYAAAGRWRDVKKIRRMMKSQADRKLPGFSWLRVNGENHVFFAEDRSYMSKKN